MCSDVAIYSHRSYGNDVGVADRGSRRRRMELGGQHWYLWVTYTLAERVGFELFQLL